MSAEIEGASILVTGGAGSFGQAFVRRVLDMGARRVAVYSRDEAKHAAMKQAFNDDRVRFMIGDVRDFSRLQDAVHDVDIVVHAAALKRVEVCELDPNEAVATNIIGTQNVARACYLRGVRQAVFLSTDKAAAPNTLYGSTKLTAERLWLQSNVYAAGTSTRFAATRYGNVLGSRGSVVPLWKQQAANGEAITITHPAMTRFWMTMDQAVDLVLLALREMRGGEVFVPFAHAAPVLDLATAIAPDSVVRSIGIRPGEKLHEVLITEDESRRTHVCGTYMTIEPEARTWGDVAPLHYSKVVVGAGFAYRSDTAERISIEELRRMAA